MDLLPPASFYRFWLRKHGVLAGLLLCLVALAAAPAQAQLPDADSYAGFRLGLNSGNINGATAVPRGQEGLTGFVGGGFLEIGYHEFWAFVPELNYLRTGYKYAYTAVVFDQQKGRRDGSFTGTRTLNYLHIPLMARFRYPFSRSWGAYANVGPALNFLLNAKETSQRTETFPNRTQDIYNFNADVKSAYKSFSLGYTLGAGATVTVWDGQLYIDLRYATDFGNIYTSSYPHGASSNLMISLGYGLRFMVD